MKKDFRHKKRFGQNFLNDPNIIRKIVRSAKIEEGDHIWEVGPGKGALTSELIETPAKITAFEIDYTLHEYLEEKFGERISLIKKDVLKVDWNEIIEPGIKIVANLPYQITSPFLFKVAEYSKNFKAAYVMIQKEVAERIQAKVGTKDYGILSLKMQYYFHPKILFKVPPHLFTPPPKVDSAVIELIPRLDRPEIPNIDLYWQVVKAAIINRRKMLRKNLQAILSKDEVIELGKNPNFDLTLRGEKLSEEDFINLHLAILDIIAKR